MVADRIYDLLPSTLPKLVGDLPSSEINVVAINEYDGVGSTEYFGVGTQGVSVLMPLIKIVIRADTYELGQQWAELVKTTLHRYHDDYFLNILLVGTPMYLGRNEMKLHEFQVTFKTQTKE